MESEIEATSASPGAVMRPARATLAALCAVLVGIGLARFAYTPLIPALIAAHWFAPSAAVYLGAANLGGYLAGALLAQMFAARIGIAATLRGAMLVATATFFTCAWPIAFGWFFLWRFAAGVAGGVLMALAAPSVLPHIDRTRRGVAAGVVFTGIGLGIAASGTFVPLLMRRGLTATWLGLGVAALVLTVLAWRDWPATPRQGRAPPLGHLPRTTNPALAALYAEYALTAVGQVPHMVFLVDFIARGLGRGLAVGAGCWVVFGLGALIGPLLAGYAGGRWGFRAALRAAFVLECGAVAILLMTTGMVALVVSSFAIGAFVPGGVTLALGRSQELVPPDPARQAAAWSYCTTAFAIGQAVAAYGFSYIFAQTGGGYPILFALAAGAFVLALAIDLAAGRYQAASSN